MSNQIQPPINGSVLEGISKVLGDSSIGLTGTEIGKFLLEVNIPDIDPSNSKWRRIYNAFVSFQNRKQLSNNILTFINKSMNPARFIGRNEQYEDTRIELNKRLSFIGLRLTDKGKFKRTLKSDIISEAIMYLCSTSTVKFFILKLFLTRGSKAKNVLLFHHR